VAKVLVVVKQVFGGVTCPQGTEETRLVLEGQSLKDVQIKLANALEPVEAGANRYHFEDFSTIQIERLPESES
jgi:hypothetical protein